MRPGLVRRAGSGLALVVALVGLGGCTGLQGSQGAGYVSGRATVAQVALDDRESPVDISGTSLEGEPVDLADLRGQVVVLNYWGSWCGPCHAEAPLLVEASQQVDAAFVGAQIREDNTAGALAFERDYGITWPTIADSGASILRLGDFAPRGNPSTYVLDREGRVAAVITGPVPSARTLEDLVEEIGAERG